MSKDKIDSRRVINIAIPMIFANITVPLLGFVDTTIIGQLGDANLIAALGLGAILISTLYWLCGFLRMGTTGLAAQAIGSNQSREVFFILIRGLIIGFILGLLLLCLSYPIFFIFFQISPAEIDVEKLSLEYAQIRVLSAPFAIATIPIIGLLIALEKTLSIFLIQVLINVANILLNVLFVFYLDLSISGVAFATLISEFLGFLFALYFAFKFTNFNILNLFSKLITKELFKKEKWKRLFSINTNIFFRSLLLELVFISFFFWAASFGTNILAVNQILVQFLHIFAYALDGFAFSGEVLVGISYGKKNLKLLKKSVFLCSIWAAITALILSIGFLSFGNILIKFMTNAEEVLKVIKDFQIWITLVPLVSFPAYIMDGIFFGSIHLKEMRKAMIVSTFFFFITAFFLTSTMQNSGLWLALNIFFLMRAVTLIYYYPNIERSVSSFKNS